MRFNSSKCIKYSFSIYYIYILICEAIMWVLLFSITPQCQIMNQIIQLGMHFYLIATCYWAPTFYKPADLRLILIVNN